MHMWSREARIHEERWKQITRYFLDRDSCKAHVCV